jgi:hypothetical protein
MPAARARAGLRCCEDQSGRISGNSEGAVAQRRVITGVPVTDQPDQAGKQVGSGLAPAEQGHFGLAAQSVLHDGAAHERRTAENKNSHNPEHYRRACR